MNISTLSITRQQAAQAVINYRRALKLNRNAEDEAILRGYNQVLKGRKLIELSKVITAGGADANNRPRLAVFRADHKRCHVTVSQDGSVHFATDKWGRRARSLNLRFGAGTLPAFTLANRWMNVEALAIMPSIPPQHRPADSLENYHILWEAEWQRAVPRDPALLRHLGGDLWAVLAMWDLTDLERAVLAGRSQ